MGLFYLPYQDFFEFPFEGNFSVEIDLKNGSKTFPYIAGNFITDFFNGVTSSIGKC